MRNLDDIHPISSQELKSYNKLIKFVDDRPGHDKDGAIDCRIKQDLNYPNENFNSGMIKTVKWYLDKYKQGINIMYMTLVGEVQDFSITILTSKQPYLYMINQ